MCAGTSTGASGAEQSELESRRKGKEITVGRSVQGLVRSFIVNEEPWRVLRYGGALHNLQFKKIPLVLCGEQAVGDKGFGSREHRRP